MLPSTINHPFQNGNGRVGRLIPFRECLRNDVMPFVIDNKHMMFLFPTDCPIQFPTDCPIQLTTDCPVIPLQRMKPQLAPSVIPKVVANNRVQRYCLIECKRFQ